MAEVKFFDDIPYVLIGAELTSDNAKKLVKEKHEKTRYKYKINPVIVHGKLEMFKIYEESPLGYY